MAPLSYVTILWSMIAAGALLLGVVHAIRWILDRNSRADLAFSVVALSFVGVAFAELGGMHAQTAEEWAFWLRWAHLPLFAMLVGTVAFVYFYCGTVRRWLMWSFIGLRTVILALNFGSDPGFNFAEISSIERISFLGGDVSVVGEAVTGRWQFLGSLTSLLLAVLVLDASITLWRRGTAEDRRRAAVIGGSMFVFVAIAAFSSQLVIWQVLRLPFLITPTFLVPLLGMAFELGRDILRASQLASELSNSQQRLELAAGAADLGFCEWDDRSNRIWATRQAREIFGIAEHEPGHYETWLARVHPDDAARLARGMQHAISSGTDYHVEFRVCAPGRQPRWILAHGRADPGATGRPARVRGMLRDVTAQRLAQDETVELRRELVHAGRVSMMGQLASSLAHELSQPLGAILRNAEAASLLLKSQSPDYEELRAIVTDIQRDDRRARDVIDRLRAMMKRRQPDVQSVAPDDLIEDVLALVQADAAARAVTLEYARNADLPPVPGDRVQLTQVLLNLVLNAMDAVAERPPGERLIHVEARRLERGAVELRVTDSGTGIPAALATRIFEPFYTNKTSGLGMGLAISRTIAESHGGSLSMESSPGAGATFCFRLPAQGGAHA